MNRVARALYDEDTPVPLIIFCFSCLLWSCVGWLIIGLKQDLDVVFSNLVLLFREDVTVYKTQVSGCDSNGVKIDIKWVNEVVEVVLDILLQVSCKCFAERFP